MKPTEPLFILTVEDAQIMAGDLIGRNLTDEEMRNVRKGIDSGLEWMDVMEAAIRGAVKDHGNRR